MSDWTAREPIFKRSELEAPFCPTCDQELDMLTIINEADSCKCGDWSYTYKNRIEFKPNPPKKGKL